MSTAALRAVGGGLSANGGRRGFRLAAWCRSVGARFAIVALVTVASHAVIIATVVVQTDMVRTAVTRYAAVDQPIQRHVQAMEMNLVEAGLALFGYVSDSNPRSIGMIRSELAAYDENLAQARRLASTTAMAPLLTALDGEATRFRAEIAATADAHRRWVTARDALVVELAQVNRSFHERLRSSILPADPQAYRKFEAVLVLEMNANGVADALTNLGATRPADTASIAKDVRGFRAFRAELTSMDLSSSERDMIADIDRSFERAVLLAAEFVGLDGERAEHERELVASRARLTGMFERQLQPAAEQNVAATRNNVAAVLDSALVAVWIAILAGAMAGVAGFAMSHLLVSRPIARLVRATNAFAGGRLDSRVDFSATGDVGDLVSSFNQMAMARETAEDEIARLNDALSAQVRQLEDSNRELESFTYSVSHDLRAPLRAIDGFTRMIEEGHAQGVDAEGREHLSTVRQSADRMGQLIDGLLRLSRLGHEAVRPTRVEPTIIVQEVLAQGGIADDPNVELVVGRLPPCHADPALLRQVFANLLQNAHKFSRDSRPARIEVGASRTGGPEIDPDTVYFVRDNGAGFDERYAHKLFGVFQRLHRADEYEGTGIGLALVQRIVERHGGRVWATGEVGVGATFSFTLPGVEG